MKRKDDSPEECDYENRLWNPEKIAATFVAFVLSIGVVGLITFIYTGIDRKIELKADKAFVDAQLSSLSEKTDIKLGAIDDKLTLLLRVNGVSTTKQMRDTAKRNDGISGQ